MKIKPLDKSLSCPCCNNGKLLANTTEFQTSHDNNQITVPNVELEQCDKCKETFLTPNGNLTVDAYLDELNQTISTEELKSFLQKYKLTQKEAAHILQIGEKNFSRWLNGKQRVSASMSNYIRTLTIIPEAFLRLKKRDFNTQSQIIAEEEAPYKTS